MLPTNNGKFESTVDSNILFSCLSYWNILFVVKIEPLSFVFIFGIVKHTSMSGTALLKMGRMKVLPFPYFLLWFFSPWSNEVLARKIIKGS